MGTYGTGYYTSNGGITWTQKFLQSSISDISGSYLASNGILYAVTLLDSYIFKNANLFTTGINTVSENIPVTTRLNQNYPNPFNPVTRISFDVSRAGNVAIKVFDVTGREVQTLVNESLNPGAYSVTFNGSTLSSGVYFYSMFTDNKLAGTKRLVIIK